MMTSPPTDDLGRRFTLTRVMSGPPNLPPEDRSVIQYVYPDAAGGTLVHTPAGQHIWEGAVGWYRPASDFDRLLAEAGVAGPPGNSSTPFVAALAVLPVAMLLSVIWWKRRRPEPDGDGDGVVLLDLSHRSW